MAKTKVQAFKVGQWVEFIKGKNEAKKGTLGVVSGISKGYKYSWASEAEPDQVYVCFNLKNGDSTYETMTVDVVTQYIKATKTPTFAVVWSTMYTDPTMLFHTLKEARSFVAELKKRKGESKRAVEVGIYNRQ